MSSCYHGEGSATVSPEGPIHFSHVENASACECGCVRREQCLLFIPYLAMSMECHMSPSHPDNN